ncbi:MAG: site-specific integrase [Muricauda sp.]|jgi:integrase|nr:site-specific integrase [Allomuricauda sp.]MBO6531935.1 site-specific integrase [Allomuricauda sp.]MBO6588600.1 site-specific integrase [Allomuricauda sp.]MBO6618261.1 site-specific integrase [Allomuricauda sp.]MBO6644138.1 site-specific integrase [Allomuricauda sp.]MBO6747022.1 site-specific integrase [Allomuricauda sp.]
MSHSFSKLFYLKGKHKENDVKVPIYLRLTVNGKRSELSISRKVDPQKWNARTGKMKGTNLESNELNQYLDTVRSRINKIHRQLVEDNKPFTSLDVKNLYLGKGEKLKMLLELFDEHNQQMKKLIDIEFALGTYKRYHTTRNHVAEFIKTEFQKSDIPIRDVDLKFIKGFEFFLKTDKKCNHNSALKYINNFKKIIRMAVAHEWISKDPFYNYKVQFKTVEREFLSKGELQALVDKKIRGKRLNVVRDMFVFCCYTGLSYIDVQKLHPDNIVKHIDGSLWIKSQRTKTKSKLGIPLLPTALDIIEKYQDHPKVVNGDCVLPVLSNQKSNAYLKEIAELCGIKKNLTTHLARHTFATTVTLSNGVPIETVGQMLGHKNLRTTQHYAKIIDRKVSDDMAALKEVLGSQSIDRVEKI